MVVRINTGAKPAGAVLYNEYKVVHGEARFLGLVNADVFDEKTLRIADKIGVLDAFTKLNERISKPTFHTSLAFHPSETLDDDQLKTIGQQYMERLGYGDQPYLVYRHEDTPHPHIHIVSVSIDHDGKRISDSHQQRRSNAIRQALEKEYGLVEAEQQGKEVLMTGLLPEQILTYKESEAKKAIGNVVRTALTDYHFSNLQTFSAFLYQHRIQLNQLGGVTAEGKPYRGITFQLQRGEEDQRGESIGPAIKASRFAFAPTYDRLEAKFKQNAARVEGGKEATRQRIHTSLADYKKLSEADFKSQLRRAGIQLIDTGKQYVYIDHKSRNVYGDTELGSLYTRSSQPAAFAGQSQLQPNPQSRVKAASVKADQPAPAPPTQNTRGSQPTPPTKTPEPTPQALALRRRVSHHYQQLRQQGVGGQPPVYFESKLIRHFPHEPLTQALVGEGVAAPAARQAVIHFEAYKQGQLPEIRAKEEAYFVQTAGQFVSLASHLPVSAISKQAFLQAAGYSLSGDGASVVHREDAQLSCPIPPVVKATLLADQGPGVAFPRSLSKAERSVYLAMAAGQTPPETISFYQVSAAHLKAVTGPLFETIAQPLNTAYSQQVGPHLTGDKPLFAQLQERGLVVEPLAGESYRMGHYLTPANQFTAVNGKLAKRLQGEPLPSVPSQTQQLRSPVGRNLVRLSQALDTQDTAHLQRVVGNQPGPVRASLGEGSPVEQARRLQAQWRAELTSQAPLNTTLPTAADRSGTTTAQPSISQLPVTSTLAQGLVDVLAKSSLTPQERYRVVTQMGLSWPGSAAAPSRLVEGEASPHPGRSYSLTPSQQALFSRPESSAPTTARLSPSDKAFLSAVSQGLSFTGLTTQQVAGLTLPLIEKLLPNESLTDFQRWYNGERGTQILTDTQRYYGEQASARRYLSALYQRGFLIKQETTDPGQARYRMGHYKADPATYVVLPKQIEEAFKQQFPVQSGGPNTYVLEGAWPAPESPTAHRMRALARAVDSGAETGQVGQQIERIHQRFPHLATVQQAQPLLDQLVSQPRSIRQSASELTSPTLSQSTSRPVTNTPVRSQETARSASSDGLLTLLEHFEQQAPQKGLLAILGESASVIRPRRKRIQEAFVRKRTNKRGV